ncbi:MAG TPA: proline--tRNA ligase, partial [Euryarchaeota archaeon]|nr:proline--tRNA ligase [Euryarchaeota archaeon]
MNEEEFSQWYNDVIERAQLCDKRYPIKGMNIWKPYGWKVMKLIDRAIHEEMERTNHDEVCFPLLIPEDEFQKEADHIEGFGDDVYWVTHAGKNGLEVKLLLRPTSETAMYSIFPLWIRSHGDLPLKIYQIVNVFRYETKQTRAFIRVREIHFFEAHTCHVDFEDAERQIAEDLEVMERISRDLCIPYFMNKRPEWDK